MKTGWLTHAGPYKVEHVPCPRPGTKVDLEHPPLGLLHTTQGATIEGALSVFREHYAPHFTVGVDAKKRARILQHVPLGEIAAALVNKAGGVETNRVVRVQVEIVGFAQQKSWLPANPTLYRLAALLVELERAAEIPLVHPVVGRDAAKWVKASGWVGHCDAPENEHWDPGKLAYRRLFQVAAEIADIGDAPVKRKPLKGPLDALARYQLNRRAAKTKPDANCQCGAARKVTVTLLPRSGNAPSSAGTFTTLSATGVTSRPKPKPKPKPKKPAPRRRYYTKKTQVSLKRGEQLAFQPGKGYYARPKKKKKAA